VKYIDLVRKLIDDLNTSASYLLTAAKTVKVIDKSLNMDLCTEIMSAYAKVMHVVDVLKHVEDRYTKLNSEVEDHD